MPTQVVIFIVDASFALIRAAVVWLTGLIGSEREDSSGQDAGTKSVLHGQKGTDSKNETWVVVKKNLILLLVGLNVIFSVLIGVGFNMIQKQEHPPVLVPVGQSASPSPSLTQNPAPSPTPSPSSLYNLSPTWTTTHWVSWAILDTKHNVFAGSDNWRQTTYLMSMIKPWIAADWINEHPNPSQSVLAQLSTMIVDSDDQMAYRYFQGQPSWDRFVHTCGITDIVYRSWSWSLTEVSAHDAVLYGECLRDGKATSPEWTSWILDKMRHVAGDGDFGVRQLFPDRTLVATKNGWYNWEGKWYINCLSMKDDWIISILQQWPYAGGDLQYGIALGDPVCKAVANQVLRLNA